MKKRFLSLAMVLCMLLTTVTALPITANAASSGTCGDNLTWTLDDSGTLTISGTGDMTNYSPSSDVPWYRSRSSIKTVIIENSVTSIGYRAFYDCSSLTSITIPDSVTSIGYRAFYGCSSLTSIKVSENNLKYSSQDGVLFDKEKTELIQCPGGKVGSYTIPDSVTSIGDSAFAGCNSLTSITIPDSVTSIGGYAFYNCSSLTDVYYGGSEDDWNKIEIGRYNDYLLNANIIFNYTANNSVEGKITECYYGSGKVTAVIELEKILEDCRVVLGVYDENNNLIAITSGSATTTDGGIVLSLSADESYKNYNVKVFFLDGFDSLNPLGNAKKSEIL